MLEFVINRGGYVTKNCVLPAQSEAGYWYVELGGGGHNRPRRIWINSRAIVRKENEGGEIVYEIADKLGYRRTEKGNIVLMPGDENIVMIFAECGYRGRAEIDVITVDGRDDWLIASREYWHSGRGALGVSEHVLVSLKDGDRVRVSRTGRLYGADSELMFVYQGNELVRVPEDEEIEELL